MIKMVKDNNYEHYKVIKSWEEYFLNWKTYNDKDVEQGIKEQIYKDYVAKCKVFQRANFKCQNLTCKHPESPLTYHHIKFNKNNGRKTLRNGLCLCNDCQTLYHNAKIAIKLAKDDTIPPHIKGHTLQLDTADNIKWREIRMHSLQIQKQCKHLRRIPVSLELIKILINWLFIPYYDLKKQNI